MVYCHCTAKWRKINVSHRDDCRASQKVEGCGKKR
jgi:hypothetical protein